MFNKTLLVAGGVIYLAVLVFIGSLNRVSRMNQTVATAWGMVETNYNVRTGQAMQLLTATDSATLASISSAGVLSQVLQAHAAAMASDERVEKIRQVEQVEASVQRFVSEAEPIMRQSGNQSLAQLYELKGSRDQAMLAITQYQNTALEYNGLVDRTVVGWVAKKFGYAKQPMFSSKGSNNAMAQKNVNAANVRR